MTGDLMWSALPAVSAIAGAAFLLGASGGPPLGQATHHGPGHLHLHFAQPWTARFGLGSLTPGRGRLVLAGANHSHLGYSSSVVLTVATLVRHRGKAVGRASFPIGHANRWEVIALIAWLGAATWLFFRPHQYITGGADVGVYVNIGANIARTGRILISDPFLADLDPALYPVFLRQLPPSEGAPYYLLPGFYVPGTERGLVVPQFYPLHPVWLAVGSSLGGLPAELLITPLWATLGALAVYMTVRRLWGWPAGLLALSALSITALQVWFGRYSTAEMLTQYLLWTGIWALIGWLGDEEPQSLWAALAGVALGEVFLARIDMYALLVLPVVVAAWRWQTRTGRRTDMWFFVPFIILALHSLLHAIFQSGPYASMVFRYGQLVMRSLAGPLAAASAVLILLIVLATVYIRRRGRTLWQRAKRLPWGWGAACMVIALAAYAYILRPRLGIVSLSPYWYGGGQTPNLDHENFIRLGWYLSPVGLALGVGGTAWMLARDVNRRTLFLLGTGLFFSIFYLWRIGANPHQIYAMRRYVPHVLPFFIVAACYFLQRLGTWRAGRLRWMSIGLTLLWISGIVWCARGFVSHTDLRGAMEQIAELNALFEPRSVLLFDDPAPISMGDSLGTPLHFLYGHDVLTLRNLEGFELTRMEETLARWQAAGRHVYWIGVGTDARWPDKATLGAMSDFTFTAAVLENTYDHKPTRVDAAPWRITIAPVAKQP